MSAQITIEIVDSDNRVNIRLSSEAWDASQGIGMKEEDIVNDVLLVRKGEISKEDLESDCLVGANESDTDGWIAYIEAIMRAV